MQKSTTPTSRLLALQTAWSSTVQRMGGPSENSHSVPLIREYLEGGGLSGYGGRRRGMNCVAERVSYSGRPSCGRGSEKSDDLKKEKTILSLSEREL